jgi:two-component system sensor histidine kinase RpfC
MDSLPNRLQSIFFVPKFSIVDYNTADKEIARNRVWLGLVSFCYIVYLYMSDPDYDLITTLMVLVGYLFLALALAIYALRNGKLPSIWRYFALTADITALSIAFATVGIYAAPAFLLYLWLVIGYGFRYGIHFLRLSSMLSLLGVGTAVFVSPYWSRQPYMTVSFLAMLLVIPAYIELLLRKLLRVSERLQDANHAKALMLAGLGSELRTPLASIRSAAEQLLRTKLELPQMDLVNSIQVVTKSVTLELDDFVDVSRIETGRTTTNPVSFSTAKAVREALQMVAAEAQAKGLQMSWHISSKVPLSLYLDRGHFMKALTNLLNNAVKFTGTGSVSVHVFIVAGASGEQMVRVEVTDEGIGVERDAKDKIWQSFVQANRQILHSYGGAGLGLSVVRQLVELMEGTVGADSELRKGSTFWFQIPLSRHFRTTSHVEWPLGLGVVLISPRTQRASAIYQHLRDQGGQVFLADEIKYVLPSVAAASDDIDRFVIMVDGGAGDAVEVAYSLRFDAALGNVAMILISNGDERINLAQRKMERKMFVTTVPAFAKKNELISALQIADKFEESRTVSNQFNPAEAGSDTPKGAKLTILLAERSASNRLVLKRQVEAAGHACFAVEDGEQVIASFAEESFNLVLMDVEISKMNGFDTTQLIRFISPDTHDLPVVGITDDITPGLKQRSIDVGMIALLARPVTAAQVAALLAECELASRPEPVSAQSEQEMVQALSSHPKFRAGKGPALNSATLSHLGLEVSDALLQEVRQAFRADAQGALAKMLEAVKGHDAVGYGGQLQTLRSAAATLRASHLEQLCNEGQGFPASSLVLQGRVLVQKIEAEVRRIDELLRDAV